MNCYRNWNYDIRQAKRSLWQKAYSCFHFLFWFCFFPSFSFSFSFSFVFCFFFPPHPCIFPSFFHLFLFPLFILLVTPTSLGAYRAVKLHGPPFNNSSSLPQSHEIWTHPLWIIAFPFKLSRVQIFGTKWSPSWGNLGFCRCLGSAFRFLYMWQWTQPVSIRLDITSVVKTCWVH